MIFFTILGSKAHLIGSSGQVQRCIIFQRSMALNMSLAAKLHHAVYNQIQGIGWLVILCDLCLRGPWMAWTRLGTLVVGLQCVVIFDVAHATCGMWPSDPKLGMLQRLWCIHIYIYILYYMCIYTYTYIDIYVYIYTYIYI